MLYAVRGFREGFIRQCFSLVGWICGYVSLMAVSQWVGAHWHGARPAVVFGVLRWIVALLAGLAVAAIFELLGERTADGIRKSPAAPLDRLFGIAMGALLGVAFVVAILVGMLRTPWPREAGRLAAEARLTAPLLAGARNILFVDRFVPGLGGIRRALDEASRRALLSSRQS